MNISKLVYASLVLAVSTAAGATIPIPTLTVLGTDPTGPFIILTSAVKPTDTLTFTARGEVFLQPGNTYGTNAAGVVTTAGSTTVGNSSANGGTTFGALLIGNSTLGFFQLFPTNASNGLGSATPSSLLSFTSVPLSTLGFASTLPVGTQLNFHASDTGFGDNSGSFTIFGQFNTADSVPEPSTLGLLFIGVLAIGASRLKNNRAAL